MIIDDVATQANRLLIHHPDAITDFFLIISGQLLGSFEKELYLVITLDLYMSLKM